ncbi:MAG: hypothetical protein QOI63_1195 [Thermoplasmata archaeon]|jgi:hypothetical protein|nr:hypothetical protein [Thermoplasmata archaeon]
MEARNLMVPEDDQLRALRWLANLHRLPGATLWDSDVMLALDWSEQRTQEALACLEAQGCIVGRRVQLAGEGFSLGFLEVTRAGLMRVREPLAYARRHRLLSHLRRPLDL